MRLTPMLSRMFAASALSALIIHLSGCDRAIEPVTGDADTASASSSAMPTASMPMPATPAANPTSSTAILPKAVPPSTSRDPQEVLLSWAKAVSLKDWPTAYGYWGDRGARSGQTLAQYTTQWSKLNAPDLEIGKGEQEGGAGSLYYTVPVTVVDGTRRIPGEVVMRRVNDVDGATAEQLRWHIESTTIKP